MGLVPPKLKWFWKGCKPNSVCPDFSGERIICLCSRYPKPVSLSRNAERAAPGFPIWPCTRWGFPCRVACASRGALLPHLFTLTGPAMRDRRFDFLWHYPSKSLSTFRPRVSQPNEPGLRGIAPFGVRTFLPRLAPEAILRPSKTSGNLAAKRVADKRGLTIVTFTVCVHSGEFRKGYGPD